MHIITEKYARIRIRVWTNAHITIVPFIDEMID